MSPTHVSFERVTCVMWKALDVAEVQVKAGLGSWSLATCLGLRVATGEVTAVFRDSLCVPGEGFEASVIVTSDVVAGRWS